MGPRESSSSDTRPPPSYPPQITTTYLGLPPVYGHTWFLKPPVAPTNLFVTGLMELVTWAQASQSVKRLYPYRHWPVSQEVQVAVLSKQVTFWMCGIKLLSSHDEVAGEIAAWRVTNKKNQSSRRCQTGRSKKKKKRLRLQTRIRSVSPPNFRAWHKSSKTISDNPKQQTKEVTTVLITSLNPHPDLKIPLTKRQESPWLPTNEPICILLLIVWIGVCYVLGVYTV